jgi:hypothetical protein
MAQPLECEGAMKSLDRPFGRSASDFLTPSTSVPRLMRSQSETLPSFPCSSGMRQWEGTSMSSAPGKRSRISRPRACSRTSGSR